MKIKDLIEQLQTFPPDALVLIGIPANHEAGVCFADLIYSIKEINPKFTAFAELVIDYEISP